MVEYFSYIRPTDRSIDRSTDRPPLCFYHTNSSRLIFVVTDYAQCQPSSWKSLHRNCVQLAAGMDGMDGTAEYCRVSSPATKSPNHQITKSFLIFFFGSQPLQQYDTDLHNNTPSKLNLTSVRRSSIESKVLMAAC